MQLTLGSQVLTVSQPGGAKRLHPHSDRALRALAPLLAGSPNDDQRVSLQMLRQGIIRQSKQT